MTNDETTLPGGNGGDFNNADDMPKYSMLMNLNRQYKLQADKMASSDIYASYSPKRHATAMSPKMNGSFRTYVDQHQQQQQAPLDMNYAS